jgi:hypothetical protein
VHGEGRDQPVWIIDGVARQHGPSRAVIGKHHDGRGATTDRSDMGAEVAKYQRITAPVTALVSMSPGTCWRCL